MASGVSKNGGPKLLGYREPFFTSSSVVERRTNPPEDVGSNPTLQPNGTPCLPSHCVRRWTEASGLSLKPKYPREH